MRAHQNTWGECHWCRNGGMEDMWWFMCGWVKEIGWEHWQMCSQVGITTAHV